MNGLMCEDSIRWVDQWGSSQHAGIQGGKKKRDGRLSYGCIGHLRGYEGYDSENYPGICVIKKI